MPAPIDEFSPRAPSGAAALVRSILRYIRPSAVQTALVVILAAILEGAGIMLLLPVAEVIFAQGGDAAWQGTGVTQQVIGVLRDVGATTTMQQLAVIGGGFVALVIVRAAILLRRDVLLMELTQGFVDAERHRFFGKLAAAQWPVIKRYRRAHLLDMMTNNIERVAVAMDFLARTLVTFALGLALLATAFIVSSVLGIALLAMLAAGLVFAFAWSRRSHAAGEALNLAHRSVMSETTRFLEGLKTAKSACAEDTLADGFAREIAEVRAIFIAFTRQQANLRNAIQILAAVGALAVLLIGYGLLGLTGPELLVMAAIILRLAPSLIALFGGIQSVAYALPAYSDLLTVEAELDAAKSEDVESDAMSGSHGEMTGSLILRDCSVQVTAPGGESRILAQVDELCLPPRTLAHIGGPSGAGKSTLAELVAGLHLPATGTVRSGQLELTPSTRRAWQAGIAFAPQEPFLFDGTVRENLCWPDLTPDDDAIWNALKTACADDLVRSLPSGLDEALLDGGARLSGGERQRLCLARALLRPRHILILDEATSAMDAELEREVVSRLKAVAGQGIIVMVSHSHNTRDLADIKITMRGGKAQLLN